MWYIIYTLKNWRYYMLVKCLVEDSINELLENTIQKVYEGIIEHPVFIKIQPKLTNSHGLHCYPNIRAYDRLPSGIDNEFASLVKMEYNDMFHYISISEEGYNNNKITLLEEDVYWNYDCYTQQQINDFPELCYFTHVLTHELQHAWQYDSPHELIRYMHEEKREVPNLDEHFYRTICEYDAEVEAMNKRREFLDYLLLLQGVSVDESI